LSTRSLSMLKPHRRGPSTGGCDRDHDRGTNSGSIEAEAACRRHRLRYRKFLAFVVGAGIIPHIPVWDMSKRDDGTFLGRSSSSTAGGMSASARQVLITSGHECRQRHPLLCLRARLPDVSLKAEVLPEHGLTPDRARYQ
jgi:hypothetical protein